MTKNHVPESQSISPISLELEDQLSRLARVMYTTTIHENSGLTEAQQYMLRFLSKVDSIKVTEAAKLLGLSNGATTVICDELIEGGYIKRTRSEKDRRLVLLTISDSGREKLDLIRKRRTVKLLDKGIREIPRDEVERCISILSLINNYIQVSETQGTKR